MSIARQIDPRRTTEDYDADNDGLIDITTLAQLNGIRYDRDGDGRNTGDAAVAYAAAFPGVTPRMGCPAACAGYELTANLDFDRNDDDAITAADGDDGYWNGGSGWLPLGDATTGYSGEFNGRGYVIENLFVSRAINNAGLFGQLGSAGRIIGVGLSNPLVRNGQDRVGPLVGHNQGLVAASYARGGSVSGDNNTGGLVGSNGAAGRIVAGYATTDVECTGSANSGAGLVAVPGAGVAASYATGAVTGNCQHKAGLTNGAAGVTASYWQTRTPADLTGNDPGRRDQERRRAAKPGLLRRRLRRLECGCGRRRQCR